MSKRDDELADYMESLFNRNLERKQRKQREQVAYENRLYGPKDLRQRYESVIGKPANYQGTITTDDDTPSGTKDSNDLGMGNLALAFAVVICLIGLAIVLGPLFF